MLNWLSTKPLKCIGWVDVQIYTFLISTLASHPCRFAPGTHWIESWVFPRAGLDNMEK
jgi:putative component of membrane protein insertase Oxa1/YidC/SpoIIIJ protein YidD